MSTINTIPLKYQTIRVGGFTFNNAEQVPYRIWFRVAVAMILAKAEKRRTRGDLAKLNPRELRDIGLSSEAAEQEIRKSFPNFSWKEAP